MSTTLIFLQRMCIKYEHCVEANINPRTCSTVASFSYSSCKMYGGFYMKDSWKDCYRWCSAVLRNGYTCKIDYCRINVIRSIMRFHKFYQNIPRKFSKNLVVYNHNKARTVVNSEKVCSLCLIATIILIPLVVNYDSLTQRTMSGCFQQVR